MSDCCGTFRHYLVNDDQNQSVMVSPEDQDDSPNIFTQRRSSKDIARNQNVLTASRVCVAMAVIVLIATLVPFLVIKFGREAAKEQYRYCTTDIDARVECVAPGEPNTAATCRNIGCCWDNSSADALADFRIPRCYHLTPSQYSYKVSSVQTNPNNDISLKLQPDYSNTVAGVSPTSANVNIQCYDNSHVVISMSKDTTEPSSDASQVSCENIISYSREGWKFLVNVTDDHGKLIVALGGSPMFFAPNYVEITVFLLSETSVFGLGQSTRSNQKLEKHWNEVVIFGNAPTFQDKETHSPTPMSGSYPVYLAIDSHGTAHGFAIETNQVVRATLHPNNQQSITFRTTPDHSLRLHAFLGPKPIDVARQIASVFGFPQLPPFWALGYHTCRRGANNTDISSAKQLAEGLFNASIPHESHCIDSDIPFWIANHETPDSHELDEISDFQEYLHNTSRKLVLVHTPLALNDTHLPVILDAEDNKYIGTYQGIPVTYLDVTHPDISSHVATHLATIRERFYFDACLLVADIPVDSSAADQRNCSATNTFPPVVQSITNLGYANSTVCLDSLHYNRVPHYAVHNVYGALHTTVITNALASTTRDEHAIVLASLSTSLTGGPRGGYWGGEIAADYPSLRQTIIQLGDTAVYGIPFTGYPICGFGLNTTREMCRLWTLAGAFYPLAMTYYDTSFEPRDLISFDEGFETIAKSAMRLRYSLLSYLHTLMQLAHLNGDPVVRPMYFEFPQDPVAWNFASQFIWGSALMIAPVLEPGRDYLQVYFPAGCWYHLHSGFGQCSVTGFNASQPVTDNEVLVHIRAGHVIPRQTAEVTTALTRENPFILIAAVAENTNCSGQLMLRNDDTEESMSILFEGSVNHFSSKCQSNCNLDFGQTSVSTLASEVYVYGVPPVFQPSTEHIEVSIDGMMESSANFTYYTDYNTLHLDFDFDMRSNIHISWS